jgi:hypothetical protein
LNEERQILDHRRFQSFRGPDTSSRNMFGNNHGNNSGQTPEDAGRERCPSPSSESEVECLPFSRVFEIARLPEEEKWLVEGFITQGSITVLASSPKAGKTWVSLALATAVASGTSALGRFHAPTPGAVVVFPAEDDPRAVRGRIEALCLGQKLSLEALPLHIITADTLRLDEEDDRRKLEALLERVQPKLLVLDPLVRLHSGAESYVGHVSEVFGYLRRLIRRFKVSILVTHHVAKNRSGASQPGQAMRGSGDIHASYDHGATLERQEDGSVRVALEHRSAPSPEPFAYRLHSKPDGGITFEVLEEGDVAGPVVRTHRRNVATATAAMGVDLRDRVLEHLRASMGPVSQAALRRALLVRNASLTCVLRELEAEGLIQHLGRMKGWCTKMQDMSAEGEA